MEKNTDTGKMQKKTGTGKMEKNTGTGKMEKNTAKPTTLSEEQPSCPRWYQDFSFDQMKSLMMLQCLMQQDNEEKEVGRTQKTLLLIGIMSTFFNLAPDVIKQLQYSTSYNAIDFLREVYKTLTGSYFEEEGYKRSYDCNERIILSSIAFLTLPEAIVELHKRLPPVIMPKLPPKPIPPVVLTRQRMDWPYQEKLFVCPDFATYYNNLQYWERICRSIPMPKVILPPKDCILTNIERTSISFGEEGDRIMKAINAAQAKQSEQSESTMKKDKDSTDKGGKGSTAVKTDNEPTKKKDKDSSDKGGKGSTAAKTDNEPTKKKGKDSSDKGGKGSTAANTDNEITIDIDEEALLEGLVASLDCAKVAQKSAPLNVPPLYGNNRLFDFTINGISENSGPVEYKLCGTLQLPKPNKKSWLGEKHTHYIISGASEDPPTCPITYEMTGVANVTPKNSDEKFFTVLKLGDGPNKIYPSGRKNLSRHWQEWLQCVDDEFHNVEREANKIIKNIEAITKLVFPDPTCDSCCSCRQTRKSYLKAKEARAPYFVIDTISEDDKKNKYIIGSMAMHSPAPTPPESTVNLLEIIASEDLLTSNLVISGTKNEKGDMQYFISGVKEEVVHQPHRVIQRPPPPPPKNVPPCVCAIQQLSNKDVTPTLSLDNIPWTKDEGLCFGKKYKPDETGAYSCKHYPGDKSCRRNPFRKDIMRRKMKAERALQEQKEHGSEKKMYSIADFQPCGDEHGLGICGGPWGALHTLTPEELAELEKERKEILKGPPCGTKPGRAVCEGPFGNLVQPPKPAKTLAVKKKVSGEEEEEEEEKEEEEEEDEEKMEKPPPPVKKEKKKIRGTGCFMSPTEIETRRKIREEQLSKFVPDLTYPGYDEPWNKERTAPSKKQSETDFVSLLKLSPPKPPPTPAVSKASIVKGDSKDEESATEKRASRAKSKRQSTKGHPGRSSSVQISKRSTSRKSKIDMKVPQLKSKSRDRAESVVRDKKVSKETSQDKTDKHSKSLKEKKSKPDNDKKISTTSPKSGGKLPQTRKTSKSATDSSKSKVKQGKTSSRNEKSSRQPSSESKSSKRAPVKESKSTASKRSRGRSSSGRGRSSSGRGGEDSKKSKEKSSTSKERKKESGKGKKESGKKVSGKKLEKHKRSSRSISSVAGKKKPPKRDKKKDADSIRDMDPDTIRRNQIQDLKYKLKSPDNYPYNIKPVELPEEPKMKCQPEYGYPQESTDPEKADEGESVEIKKNKEPCGWRTKSEQELPPKKTLVYLSKRDYPPRTIEVAPGGKPCLCRENRAKKKVLRYNIGGLTDVQIGDKKKKLSKKKEDDKKNSMQVLDGVVYFTPPPSPRRSEEYIPEYDVYKSLYDMCLRNRKDKNLKFIERYSVPGLPKDSKGQDPCGCNKFIDTYGIQALDDEAVQKKKELDKVREDLMNAMPPKDRWKAALNDVGLIDYFARCRDSIPCWLKCAKFDDLGCPMPYPKLQKQRPVCECKYERKILEHEEEKVNWKKRQQRLKSEKKQPFVNIADISKPLEANTKLMISGVKRIPKEDEYIDDVKYCITGVAEHYDESPPQQVVAGIHMLTPVQTPVPSTDNIPCVCMHKHWSVVHVPPGPLPKPEEIALAEKKRRQEAVIDAFKQIYAPEEVYDTHGGHSCKDSCVTEAEAEDVRTGKSTKQKQSIADQQQKRFSTEQKKFAKKAETQKSKGDAAKSSIKGGKNAENEMGSQNVSSHPQMYDPKNMENADAEEAEETFDDTEKDFMIIVQIELKKMAAEGFIFAKLPNCFAVPQLQYWLMYRKGFILSDTEKYNTVKKSVLTWNVLDVFLKKTAKVTAPSLELTSDQIEQLTFENVKQMKKKIEMKKAIFYSQVRKKRVMFARAMWNTMEYGKFPSPLFKQAYFTYMAGKEADGHVFKPWFPYEI